MRPADEVWLAVPMTRRGRDRDPRVRRLCRLIGLGSLGGRRRARPGRGIGRARPLPAAARSAKAHPAAQRARPPPRRPVARRLDPPADHDRLSPTRAGLCGGTARRPRPSSRPTGCSRRRRPNPAAQCLWLVRAHRARPLSPDLPWRSCPAALARSGPGDCTVAQGLLAAMTVPSCHRAQSEAISGGAAGQPAFII